MDRWAAARKIRRPRSDEVAMVEILKMIYMCREKKIEEEGVVCRIR